MLYVAHSKEAWEVLSEGILTTHYYYYYYYYYFARGKRLDRFVCQSLGYGHLPCMSHVILPTVP